MKNFIKQYRNHIALHFTVFIWGFTGILGKLISIDSFSIVWWRMLIALVGLLLFMAITRRSFVTSPLNRAKYIFTGLITAGHWLCFFEALKVSNVSVTLTTLSTTSLFVALLEPLLLRKKFVWYQLLLGIFTLCGLLLIFQFETQYALGIMLALAAAFLAALFGTLNALYVQTDRPSLITSHEMLGGVIGISIYTVLNAGQGLEFSLSGLDLMYLLVLGLVCTAMAFVVSIEVLKELSAFTVSISINMEPIYAILFALWIFGEEEYMSTGFYFGAVIIIGAILANAWLKSREKRKSAVKKRLPLG